MFPLFLLLNYYPELYHTKIKNTPDKKIILLCLLLVFSAYLILLSKALFRVLDIY
jgi:hypothetical protein